MNKLLKSVLADSALLALVLLFLPLPHGGSIGVAIIHELGDVLLDIPKDYSETKNRRAERESKKDALHKKLSARFKASIDAGDYMYSDSWPMVAVMGVRV